MLLLLNAFISYRKNTGYSYNTSLYPAAELQTHFFTVLGNENFNSRVEQLDKRSGLNIVCLSQYLGLSRHQAMVLFSS